jgi:hypothetical protein
MSFDIIFNASFEKIKPIHYSNGYQLFCKEMRGQGIKGVSQKRWRTMSISEREMWNTKAYVTKDALTHGNPIPLYALPCKPKNSEDAARVAIEGEVWRVMSWWRKNENNNLPILNKMSSIGKPLRKRNPKRI